MTAARSAPPSARPSPRGHAVAHPNARALYRNIERYLVGACNENALTAWRLAVGTALGEGVALDEVIRQMAEAWLRWNANALRGMREGHRTGSDLRLGGAGHE